MPVHDELRRMAKRYLNESGEVDVELFLAEQEEYRAAKMLLGAIDYCFEVGYVTGEEAAADLALLPIDPGNKTRLREELARKQNWRMFQ